MSAVVRRIRPTSRNPSGWPTTMRPVFSPNAQETT